MPKGNNTSNDDVASGADINVRRFGNFEVGMYGGKSVLRRPGTRGTEGILPRDIPMSGDELAKRRGKK